MTIENFLRFERKGKVMPKSSQAQRMPQVIFVGPEQIGQFLQNKKADWDFVSMVPNIASLWEGLNSGTIPNDAQIILTMDAFFIPEQTDPNGSLQQLIAVMAPHCFFGVLQYKPQYEAQLREETINQSIINGQGEDPEYYFIDVKKPTTTIDRAIARYIENHKGTPIANILEGKDDEEPEEEVQEVKPEPVNNFNNLQTNTKSDYYGKVIAVTSSKGGSGKSTVAITVGTYLAHASENSYRQGLAKRPLKIIVLDLDVRDGQIGFLTGNMKPTVLNLRSKSISDEILDETVIHSDRLKLDMLLAPKKPRLADDTPPEFYLELIQFLKQRYDYIILDTSVNYLDPLLEKVAYPIADKIIFVTDIVVNSIYSMTRWIQEVTGPRERQGMAIPKRKIGIVVNKSMMNVSMPGTKIRAAAQNVPIISVIPNNAKLLAHAANLTSMETVLQHDDIRKSIRRIARGIISDTDYQLSDDVRP